MNSYKVPKAYTNVSLRANKNQKWLSDTSSFTVPKETGTYFGKQLKMKFTPGPGKYELIKKWSKSKLGHMKGSERNTFIQKVFTDAKKGRNVVPGPG